MWTRFQEFPYIRTLDLVEVLFLKRYGFDYTKRDKVGRKHPN